MSEPSPEKDAAELFEIKQHASELAATLPKKIKASAFTAKSKLPFKALAIRELLIHRTVALTAAAIELFEKGNTVPAVILTRSIFETLAVLVDLRERLENFLENRPKDFNALNTLLMERLMGSRNSPDPSMPKAVNILTVIDKVDKTLPDFRSIFDSLCEYAHPNWAGTFGSFGNAEIEGREMELRPNIRARGHSAGLLALCASLIAFKHNYSMLGEQIQKLNDYIEKNGMGTAGGNLRM